MLQTKFNKCTDNGIVRAERQKTKQQQKHFLEITFVHEIHANFRGSLATLSRSHNSIVSFRENRACHRSGSAVNVERRKSEQRKCEFALINRTHIADKYRSHQKPTLNTYASYLFT